MRIDEIKYLASGNAAIYDDIFTFYIYFYRYGEFVDSTMISGYSIAESGTVYPIAPVDADSMAIEAVDLDFDTHTLEINGRQYTVPKTGSRSIFFETPSLVSEPELAVIQELPEATMPYIEPLPVPVAIASQLAAEEIQPLIAWKPSPGEILTAVSVGVGLLILGKQKGGRK